MHIISCPKCGRMPKIYECFPIKGKRQRIICCPNLCCIFKRKNDEIYEFYITYLGEGDDNALFKKWNRIISEE